MGLKSILKLLVPPVIWQVTRRMISGPAGPVAESDAVRRLREQHVLRNAATPANRMRLRDDIELHVHPDSRWGFEHFCFIDPEMVVELDSFLSASVNCHRLLDIGALHGLFSLAFTSRNSGSRAIAVDASPRAFCRLLYHIHHNSECHITPVELAISDADGLLKMSYEWEHAVASLQQSGDERGNDFEVSMTTGDALCERLGFTPDCIKIDVEGHEASVLRGLSETIRNHRPLIFLEVHPSRLAGCDESVTGIGELMRRLNYSCFSLWGSEINWPEMSQFQYEFRVIARPV